MLIDGTFVGARKGASIGPTKRGKGSKLRALVDADGRPLSVLVTSASPAEVTLVEPLLAARLHPAAPGRLIGRNAYDSDGLDARLAEQGTELIAPNRRNRRKTPAGQPLRRYRRRWKVERLFAWLANFRRLGLRYDVYQEAFLGFVQHGLVLVLLRGRL